MEYQTSTVSLLYALVKSINPIISRERSSEWVSTSAIISALVEDNSPSSLHSFDILPENKDVSIGKSK